jgi:toxin ParE1/3/4
MSWSIRWSGSAKADLVDIWVYIANENEHAADRQISRIERSVDKLVDFPNLGPARDDIGSGIRAILQNRYLILYRTDEKASSIDLLRVIDGRRDLAALFLGGMS